MSAEPTPTPPTTYDALGTELWEELRQSQPPTNRPLFHYTRPQAFQAIVESGILWATSLAYLNDASEMQYAHDLFATIAADLIVKEESDLIRSFLQRAVRAIDPFDGSSEYYVICFCEDGDLLSQWRAYGGHGGGYAIGFSGHDLNVNIDAKTVGPSGDVEVLLMFRKVIYDATWHRDRILRIVQSTVAILRGVTAGKTPDEASNDLAEAVGFMRRQLMEAYLFIKSPAFREEGDVPPTVESRGRLHMRTTPGGRLEQGAGSASC